MESDYVTKNAKYFRYLFALQKSGRTNMFGAANYLQREMKLGQKEAKEVLVYWMTHYEELVETFLELGEEVKA
jgi:hypothetical protein